MEGELKITKIEKNDLLELKLPTIGGTEIILQRHGAYERDTNSPEKGGLTLTGVESTKKIATEALHVILPENNIDACREVDILVVGSDTQYYDGGMRSIETADIMVEAVKQRFNELGLDEAQLLNNSKRFIRVNDGSLVRPVADIREPKILHGAGTDEQDPFLTFLIEQHGEGKNGAALAIPGFVDFEEDRNQNKRKELGSEGPDDIAHRTMHAVAVLARFARAYHNRSKGEDGIPKRRLVIWAATHYDTIAPVVKRKIFGDELATVVNVDYGAGIAISINLDGECKTVIGGKEYNLDVADKTYLR